MSAILEQLWGAYEKGMSYQEYVGSMDPERQAKHLHYKEKMALTEEEKKRISETVHEGDFVVFCDPSCNDCRIVTAVLENIQLHDPGFRLRLSLREEQEPLMKKIHGEARIPMVVELKKKDWRLVFYEIPEKLKKQAENQEEAKRGEERRAFQRGFYKDMILDEFLLKVE